MAFHNPPFKDRWPTANQSGEAIKIITQTCKVIKKASARVGYACSARLEADINYLQENKCQVEKANALWCVSWLFHELYRRIEGHSYISQSRLHGRLIGIEIHIDPNWPGKIHLYLPSFRSWHIFLFCEWIKKTI